MDENTEHSHTSEEIKMYAMSLGINPQSEPELMNIAREGIYAALPADWKVMRDENNQIFYYNVLSGTSLWDHPKDDYYRRRVVEARLTSKIQSGKARNRTESSSWSATQRSTSSAPTRGHGRCVVPLPQLNNLDDQLAVPGTGDTLSDVTNTRPTEGKSAKTCESRSGSRLSTPERLAKFLHSTQPSRVDQRFGVVYHLIDDVDDERSAATEYLKITRKKTDKDRVFDPSNSPSNHHMATQVNLPTVGASPPVVSDWSSARHLTQLNAADRRLTLLRSQLHKSLKISSDQPPKRSQSLLSRPSVVNDKSSRLRADDPQVSHVSSLGQPPPPPIITPTCSVAASDCAQRDALTLLADHTPPIDGDVNSSSPKATNGNMKEGIEHVMEERSRLERKILRLKFIYSTYKQRLASLDASLEILRQSSTVNSRESMSSTGRSTQPARAEIVTSPKPSYTTTDPNNNAWSATPNTALPEKEPDEISRASEGRLPPSRTPGTSQGSASAAAVRAPEPPCHDAVNCTHAHQPAKRSASQELALSLASIDIQLHRVLDQLDLRDSPCDNGSMLRNECCYSSRHSRRRDRDCRCMSFRAGEGVDNHVCTGPDSVTTRLLTRQLSRVSLNTNQPDLRTTPAATNFQMLTPQSSQSIHSFQKPSLDSSPSTYPGE